MGVKISKCYFPYKSQPKAFKVFLKFPPNGSHQIMLGILEILSFRFLNFFFFEKLKFTIVTYG